MRGVGGQFVQVVGRQFAAPVPARREVMQGSGGEAEAVGSLVQCVVGHLVPGFAHPQEDPPLAVRGVRVLLGRREPHRRRRQDAVLNLLAHDPLDRRLRLALALVDVLLEFVDGAILDLLGGQVGVLGAVDAIEGHASGADDFDVFHGVILSGLVSFRSALAAAEAHRDGLPWGLSPVGDYVAVVIGPERDPAAP